uniref:Retrovirus-related Pol polyprotein from transposon TNT 1-94 n=1 Tax=Tanacetum cinerariifolium TaxID=118510 RepID=A0A6L2JY96_TANCI|nr:retrovirus-related Pol polyprotein from transposon TNT 1-94 [Tanacetum cinerariifolium]
MTPRLDLFFDFLECDGGRVLLGDNRECKIRVGKIKVINGSRVVLSGTRRDNCVYSLDGHAVAGELNASVEEKDSLAQVWHKRLGHISEAGLQVLEKQCLFGKKSLGKLDFYENYVLGKSHRVSFGVGRHTTQGVIDYVRSDLWGPSQVESLGGKRFFLSIVDDYSRRVWVYLLRFKHNAFEKFKEWKQLVENQTGRTVKKLRTDNGLEFCNREFKKLCIASGIARHLTVDGTPQQNGLAERINRTLMDKVRCLLIQSGLPKTFWAEATCTAAYLINRSPSTAIEKKTPMEMWSGHPSDYEMLRTFGCVAYSHVQQGKLEPRAVKCVLLGYPEGMKGYRLYRLDNESPKIVTSRNVVFIESVMYKDTLKDSGAGADKYVEELLVEVEQQRTEIPNLWKWAYWLSDLNPSTTMSSLPPARWTSKRAALKEFDQKRATFETVTVSKTFNKHPKHKALYHALMESILADEDAMEKGVADIQKKRKLDDADRDEDPPVRPDQGAHCASLPDNERIPCRIWDVAGWNTIKGNAIKAYFLANHPMHQHRMVLVKHQRIQYKMKMKMDYHEEKPERTNHVANGIPLLVPQKPQVPAEDQETTHPRTSVTFKMVAITEAVEVLVLPLEFFSQIVHIDANDFSYMKKLRILKIYQEEQYLPSYFYPEIIVAIDLSYSNIKQLWSTPKCFRRLKVMKLRYSCKPTTTLDFSEITNLKELDLEDCTRVRSFPSKVEMDSLEVLNLLGFLKVDKLSEDLGKIKSLTELYADRTAITEVPSFVSSLTNLELLSFGGQGRIQPRWWTSITISFGLLGNFLIFKNFNVDGCKKLEVLPELSPGVWKIDADDCTSLRKVLGSSKEPFRYRFNHFKNCPNLFKNVNVDSEGSIWKTQCLDSCITSQGFIHQLSAFLGLQKDKKNYKKSSKVNEVLQPKSSPNTKSFVRRLPKEVAKEKGPVKPKVAPVKPKLIVKPKAAPVKSNVGKRKRLVDDKEVEDEHDSNVKGSDGESNSDKEHKGSEEANVVTSLRRRKLSKKKKQVNDVKKQKHVFNSSSSYDESCLSSEGEKVSKPKIVSKKNKQVKDVKKKQVNDESSLLEDEKPLKNKKKRSEEVKDVKKTKKKPLTAKQNSLPSQFATFAVRAFSGSSYEFKLDKGIIHVTPEKVYKIFEVHLGGTSIFDLPEIPLDNPFVKDWFKQFDPKPLKEIHAPDIAKKLVLAKTVDFMFKVNFLMLFADVMGTADTMKAIVNLTILRRFYNVGDNVSRTRTSSVPPTDKQSFCKMMEEKISLISDEKETVLPKGSQSHLEDFEENYDDGAANVNGAEKAGANEKEPVGEADMNEESFMQWIEANMDWVGEVMVVVWWMAAVWWMVAGVGRPRENVCRSPISSTDKPICGSRAEDAQYSTSTRFPVSSMTFKWLPKFHRSRRLQNCCRFPLEIVEAISKERVFERVKIRLSPFINYNESGDSDPHLLGIYMAESLSQPGITYCHVIEQRMVTRFERVETWNSLAALRKVFKGTFMVAVGYHDRDEANHVVENGDADLVAFARVVFG